MVSVCENQSNLKSSSIGNDVKEHPRTEDAISANDRVTPTIISDDDAIRMSSSATISDKIKDIEQVTKVPTSEVRFYEYYTYSYF